MAFSIDPSTSFGMTTFLAGGLSTLLRTCFAGMTILVGEIECCEFLMILFGGFIPRQGIM
jgi:hypothetical protein